MHSRIVGDLVEDEGKDRKHSVERAVANNKPARIDGHRVEEKYRAEDNLVEGFGVRGQGLGFKVEG